MSGRLTLANFYKSDEWYKLTQQIKNERVNKNDEIICAHCGMPIVRSYDCICHHTIYLTEENVNDYAISLNPDLIQTVHHKCHNEIHEKLGYVQKEIYLVYGPPLAGKTSWVKHAMGTGDLIIDMDSIWECVSGCPRYVKPGQLNAVVFGIRDELMQMTKRRVGKWNNAYIVGGFPLISERERICREYGAREVYIECSKEECLTRLKNTDDGRNKKNWEKFIDEWFRRYAPKMH